jgi:polyphosphate kinase
MRRRPPQPRAALAAALVPVLGLAAACALAAPAARAHPHIWIDAGLTLVFDQAGMLAAVRVAWVYDAFYSLMVLEELGLDDDLDGVLRPDELTRLDGFDMAWDADYAGDLYVFHGERPVDLSRPLEHATEVRDGRIVTLHTRALAERLDPAAGPIRVRVYDPSFYTAYSVALPTRIEGRAGCAAELFRPDLDAAQRELLAALQELGATESVEDIGFPAVGAQFADEVRVTCAP